MKAINNNFLNSFRIIILNIFNNNNIFKIFTNQLQH